MPLFSRRSCPSNRIAVTRPFRSVRRSLPVLLFGLAAVAPALVPANAYAETYYVDANSGDDRRDGKSPAGAWRNLTRLNSYPLVPGDRVMLVAGSVWKQPLTITRSGRKDAPIRIGVTGAGARPRIEAGGVSPHGVALLNVEYVHLRGLEVTNDGPPAGPRHGVLVSATDKGVMRGIRVTDMYIHDVRGTNDRKDNGGIVFQALGPHVPTRFDDLLIERNIVWRVDRSGIAGISDQVTAARWFPSRGIVIRDNYLEDVGGDGIVPRGTDGALIEHNIVRSAGSRAPGYNAAIWQWSTDHSLIQLNEAAFTRTRYDGQGFDSDFNSRRTTIVYNYSHDNAGGFLLICSPRQNNADNLGNRGTIARYNVSRNDGSRIFQLSGNVQDAVVEHNVVHVGADKDMQMVIATEWQGWARDVEFRGNVFAVAGQVRYGREVGRKGPDYLIAPGFNPAEQIRFSGNSYLGRHIDAPKDADGIFQPTYVEPQADWNVPQFDPKDAQGLAEYMVLHRNWMLSMLRREIGALVKLQQPRTSGFLNARPRPAPTLPTTGRPR